MRRHACRPRSTDGQPAAPLVPVHRSAPDHDEVLGLQRSAGNAAVVAALKGAPVAGLLPAVQRQPKAKQAKQTPQFVKDAQAELASLFPKDKLMGKVSIKDYGDLNKVLTTSTTFMAWTQSSTEIFVRDTSGLGDPDSNDRPKQLLRYILKHEAVHVGQFAKAKGPPATWEQMLRFEQEGYKSTTLRG